MSTFNSINTNRQAVFALQALNQNTSELSTVQKRVSTGFRVADSRDDTGAFSVAQSVRSDIAGVTAVNEQLGGARGRSPREDVEDELAAIEHLALHGLSQLRVARI